jgi:hypothetical protein
MGMNDDRIVQMMPAEGWYARYVLTEPPYYRLEPLVAWVLVEVGGDPKDRWIQGFEAGNSIQPPNFTEEDSPIFCEYVHREHCTDVFRELWAEESRAYQSKAS